MRTHPLNPSLSLVEPSDLALDGWCRTQDRRSVVCYFAALAWLEYFLGRPHPELGRGGAVCPFIKAALEKGLVWLTCVRGPVAIADVADSVMRYGDWFLELEPRRGDESIYKAILILFPDLVDAATFSWLDSAHTLLKPDLVQKGLMIGRFHPQSDEQDLHSPRFRPSCPVPMLALGAMTRHDLPFLADGVYREE
jgi:hypothetical protein